jgi:hypothetical protein
MPVPEAAMDQDRDTVLGQNDVRAAWQIAAVNAKAVTEAVKGTADRELGFGVARWDTRHIPAAPFLR